MASKVSMSPPPWWRPTPGTAKASLLPVAPANWSIATSYSGDFPPARIPTARAFAILHRHAKERWLRVILCRLQHEDRGSQDRHQRRKIGGFQKSSPGRRESMKISHVKADAEAILRRPASRMMD